MPGIELCDELPTGDAFAHSAGADSETLHGPAVPADIRRGELVSAWLTVNSHASTQRLAARVWRISPFAIELIIAESAHEIDVGTRVDLTLLMGDQRTEMCDVLVARRTFNRGHDILGIQFYEPVACSEVRPERRANDRFPCSAHLPPTITMSNAVRYEDSCCGRVSGMSRGGLCIHTSLRNKFMIRGTEHVAEINFPSGARVSATVRIIHASAVTEGTREVLVLGAEWVNATPELLAAIGQHLLEFSVGVSHQQLQRSGLRPHSCGKAIEFGFVSTQDEYKQVLELRRLAYSGAGKVNAGTTASSMGDEYDSRARIIIGKHHGQVVASVRLIYHEPHEQMEHEEFIPWPLTFPSKTELVELTRVCTDPRYRGSDLLLELFRFTGLTVLQSKRRWLVGSSTDKLLPVYTRIGFKKLPLSYSHANLGNQPHTMFIADIARGLTGAGSNPVLWNLMYAKMVQYLDRDELNAFTWATRVRLACYRACAPLTEVLVRRMQSQRKHAA